MKQVADCEKVRLTAEAKAHELEVVAEEQLAKVKKLEFELVKRQEAIDKRDAKIAEISERLLKAMNKLQAKMRVETRGRPNSRPFTIEQPPEIQQPRQYGC